MRIFNKPCRYRQQHQDNTISKFYLFIHYFVSIFANACKKLLGSLPKCDYRVVVHYLTMSIATSIHMHNLFFWAIYAAERVCTRRKLSPKWKLIIPFDTCTWSLAEGSWVCWCVGNLWVSCQMRFPNLVMVRWLMLMLFVKTTSKFFYTLTGDSILMFQCVNKPRSLSGESESGGVEVRNDLHLVERIVTTLSESIPTSELVLTAFEQIIFGLI